jgi:hypothetical protein
VSPAENLEAQPRFNADQSQQGQAPRRNNNQDPRRQKNRNNQNNMTPRHQGQTQNQGYRDHSFKDRRPQPQQGYPSDIPVDPYPQDPYARFEQEVVVSENLETMSENQLATKIRQLESMLNKEQSRTEAAEKMAQEAKQYAEIIKAQAGLRVAEVKQSMEVLITQLRSESEVVKNTADENLRYYREQLEKANNLILNLIQK